MLTFRWNSVAINAAMASRPLVEVSRSANHGAGRDGSSRSRVGWRAARRHGSTTNRRRWARTLNLTAFQFGLIGALGGIGAVLGAAVTTRVGLRLGTGRTIIACHLITTTSVNIMAAAGETPDTWTAVVVLGAGVALYGLALGMSNSHEMSYRQLLTPR
jgi:hypothetical protein